jgi:sigma-B regulation protein RsbU (phosphoserine phosphatase)
LKILVLTSDAHLAERIGGALVERGHEPVRYAIERLAPRAAFPATVALVDANSPADSFEALVHALDRVVAIGDRWRVHQVLESLRAGACDFLALDFLPAELDAVLTGLQAARGPSRLLEISQGGKSRAFVLRAGPLTIGRDPQSGLCIETTVVSRTHARILEEKGQLIVEDCGSRHGIYVNDARVTRQALTPGAKIRLGRDGAPVLTFHDAAVGAPVEEATVEPAADDPTGSSQEMRDIATLVDTFLKLNGDLLLDDILQIVVARSVELADADRGMILLVASGKTGDEDEPGILLGGQPLPGSSDRVDGAARRETDRSHTPELRVAMARHRDGSPLGEEGLQISKKIPLEVLATGRGIILEDLLAPESIETHPATIKIGVRGAMCVPLRGRRSRGATGAAPILGVLYVDSATRTKPFSKHLLVALESLASEAAQAIRSSQLYEEHLQKRELDSEMRIAREIQRSFLPPSSYANDWLEIYGSSQASKEVGGDLLDYHPQGADRLGIVIGDVSGKGVPAAIFSSMLDGFCKGVQSRSGDEPDLASGAAELNRYLVEKSRQERFFSAIFANVWSDGRFSYVNAGHNPPLRVRGSSVEVLRQHGVILGVFEEASYKVSEVRLEPGDVVVLHSDGVTDTRSPTGERFADQRLREVIARAGRSSARQVHDAILDATRTFAAGVPAADDATLMVVRYAGRKASAPPARGPDAGSR